MSARPAAGGGHWVDIPPERLARWLENFAGRHGGSTVDGLRVTGADGAVAEFSPPPGLDGAAGLGDLTATPGPVGLLLARKGAIAAGVAEGSKLTASKVDTHYVQGRTAAGGWSQQRFARRRVNQARAAAQDGADIVARVLLPRAGDLRALVTGGDRGAVDAVLADPRLAPLAALRHERFLDVPEPRHAVLENAVTSARALRVRIVEIGS